MDPLGRYYTQELFSNLLVNQFNSKSPKNIIDIGVGAGSLLKAASLRWKNASYYAVDIDQNSIHRINIDLPFVKIINANSLNENIANELKLAPHSVDVAVCNPPYLKIRNQIIYSKLLNEALMGCCNNMKVLTSDIIFLAQNLKLLKEKGELGIILPDSLITGHNFEQVRKSILLNHKLKAIIELPGRIFPKTDAKTHILLIEKNSVTECKVPLFIAGKDGKCYDQIEIPSSSLFKRMDYTFHKWSQKQISVAPSILTLRDLDVEITRGRLTHAELKSSKEDYLHTTTIKDKSCNYSLISRSKKYSENCFAVSGDILVARVGSGCIGKTTILKSGRILITDCLYKIRVKEELRESVWLSLSSEAGRNWLKANSHGVCAKVISKKDLLNFPIVVK